MSRIYFHSPTATVEVRGAERAAAGFLCDNLFAASLCLSQFTRPDDKIFSLLSEKDRASIRNYPRPDEAFMSLCRFGERSLSLPDGQTIPAWDAILNTALVMGSNPIKLLARLHAQCEIHTYVEGTNREWLADIVHEGLKTGIMRDNMGWQAVEALLRLRDDEPVVTSYSVCEQFPNAHVSTFVAETDDESKEDASDQWYNLPDADRWEMALEGLRKKAYWLEMRPDFWDDYYFSNGYTGFDLTKIAYHPKSYKPKIAHNPHSRQGKETMQAYILPRAGGKTTKLIKLAAARGGYIVCLSRKDAYRIAQHATSLGLNIPFPITLEEFKRGQFSTHNIKEFYFDDIDRILAAIAGNVPVVAFSMTGVVEQKQPQ